jgi:DNA-binding winged helix-turn-helix (wHTH) protein
MIRTTRNWLVGLWAKITISFVIFTGIIFAIQILLLALYILIVVLPGNNLQPAEFKQVFEHFLGQSLLVGFLINGMFLSFLLHRLLRKRHDQSSVDMVQLDFNRASESYESDVPSLIAPKAYMHKDLNISTDINRVTKGGNEIVISTNEFELLRILAENIGETVTKEFLLTSIVRENNLDDPVVLRDLIDGLRKKIEPDPLNPIHIISVGIKGYMMPEEDAIIKIDESTSWV